MSTIENLAHKVTIDKLGEGVFLHKKHKDKDDGFIFTKGFGVVNEEYIWFYTPDGKVQGKHRIVDTYVDGVVYPDKDALSLKLKEIGHIIYDATAAAPADYTDVLNSILEAVDGLELNTENINLNAEQINLNTDEVEELLTDIKDLLTADTIGVDCDTPSFTKDCDRAELLDKLNEVATLITENASENTTDLSTILNAIKLVADSIQTNTATSNTNEALIITELETANTNLEEVKASIEFAQDVFQVEDCEGNPIGAEQNILKVVQLSKQSVNICNIQELADAINNGALDYTTLLTSIDTKLNELEVITAELETANTTLTSIEGDTTAISTNTADILTQVTTSNTKLEDIKTKLDTQITLLGELKTELVDVNVSLDTANATLNTISGDVALIKADIADIKVDIAAIKTSVQAIEADTEEIKVAVQSIDTKLTTVNDHLTTIEGKLDTINTTLQTEFDQTQEKLDDVITALEFAQDTFQIKDCDGVDVGTPENVLKVVQLSKQTADICNTDDITTPIVDKLDEILLAINSTEAPDYTALLTSIDTKLDELAVITTELETANTTLTGIKVDTAGIKTDTAGILTQVTTANTNLVNIKTELEAQTTKLEDIKTLITTTNTELVAVNAELDTISGNILTIKNDIATIKADIADIKTGVQSIDIKLNTVIDILENIDTVLGLIQDSLLNITDILQDIKDELDYELVYTAATKVNNSIANFYSREKIVWDSETNAEISRVTEFSTDGVAWTVTAPTGTLLIGWLVEDTSTALLDKLDDVIAAINDTSAAEQVILTSIDTKLEDLADIKTELVTANTTLSGIKTDTTDINTNLLDVISNLDTQITLLTDIKAEAVAGNVKLEDIKALLITIDTNIEGIRNDLVEVKTDVAAIKASTASIDTKLTSVVSSLTAIEGKLDTLHSDLTTINSTLQTEFDQTQTKLDEVVTALEYAQDTFQLQDCEGNDIGVPENVIKVIQIAKQEAKVCNTAEISDPIVAAIEAQAGVGKKQDLLTWVAAATNVLSIPQGKFNTISLLASKGEFKIENNFNDFSSDFSFSAGTLNTFIEISSDGVGTASGATDLPQGIDTRANSKDLNPLANSYTITCVRAGVLTIEAYRE